MNQTLTFTAFLKDEYTKRFDQLANRSDADIKKIESRFLSLGKSSKQVALSINDITKRIDMLTRVKKMSIDTSAIKFATNEINKLQRQKDRLEGSSSSIGGSSFGMGGLLRSAVPYVGGFAAGNFLIDSFKSYAQFGMQQKTYEVLTGSKKTGQDLANELFHLKQETVMGPAVYKAAQTLLGFGVQANEVIKVLKMLGDVSMGDADKLQSLTLAFSQTRQAGRLMGQDTLQYINAGFNPLTVMAEKWQEFGFKRKMSGIELRQMMEKGQISAAMVGKAFEIATSKGGRFFNMMNEIKTTSGGQMAMLSGKWAALKIALGERNEQEGNSVVKSLSSLVDLFKKIVEVPVSEKIQREAGALAALQSELNASNTTEGRRKEILDEINSKYNITLKNLGDEKQAYADLNTEINNVINSLQNKAIVTRMQEGLKDLDDKIADITNTRADMYISAISGAQTLKRLDQEEVKKLRTDNTLTTEQKMQKLYQMTLKAGYVTTSNKAAYDIITGGQMYGFYGKTLSQRQQQKEEKKKLLQETMDEFGISEPGGSKRTGRGGRHRVWRNGGWVWIKDADTSGGGSGAGGGVTDVPSISGGSKITHLTINIDALIKGGVNMYETHERNVAKMKDVVTETLLTAVNDANLAAGK